jgi:hypothetical protein
MQLSQQQFLDQIDRTLCALQLPEEARDVCAAALLAEFQEDSDRLLNRSLNEKNIYYAIHNDDFKLIDESAAIAAALWTIYSNPIAVIGKLLALLYRYRRKRAKLTQEQALVLLSLKQAPEGGWTVQDVTEHLPLKEPMAVEAVQKVLDSLKSVTQADGKLTSFVTEHREHWLALDLALGIVRCQSGHARR